MLPKKWGPSAKVQPRDDKEALRQGGGEAEPKILQKMQRVRGNAVELDGFSEVLQYPMRGNAGAAEPIKIISNNQVQVGLKGTSAGG